MAKKIDGYIKLQVPAGKANPSPPIGPALGQKGVNIMAFCKEFNAATSNQEPGLPIPTEITVYNDKSFTFIMKSPPAAYLLRKAAGIATKDADLTAADLDAAVRTIAGTARSMGISVEGV